MNRKKKILLTLINHVTEIVLLIVVAFLWIYNDKFMSVSNWMNILRSGAIKGIIALGVTFVLSAGKIDLSTGSQVAMSGMVVAWCCKYLPDMIGIGLTGACLIGMLIALLIAAFCGLLHALIQDTWNIPPFIITLATQYLLYGAAATLCDGYPISNVFPNWFREIGMGRISGVVPYCVILFLVFWAAAYFIYGHTTIGRSVLAIGGNQEAARLSGINVRKVKIFVFVFVQCMAAIAGFINSAQVTSADYTYGKDWPMDIISMTIIGGTSMTGGSGTMYGTMIGVVLISVLLNGMTILNWNIYVQYIVRGAILLLSVLLMTYRDKLRD